MKKFLITRPKYDIVTSYLYEFSRSVVRMCKEDTNIFLMTLEGPKVTRKELERKVCKRKPRLIFTSGHGGRDFVGGHEEESILDVSNIHLAKGAIIYALSCDSLEGLGTFSIQHGVKAYVGYNARFMLVTDNTRHNSPNKDNNALPFRRATFTTINALLSGLCVGKAVELTEDEYQHSIRPYGTSNDDSYGDISLIRFALAWNLEFLGYCGDPHAAFV